MTPQKPTMVKCETTLCEDKHERLMRIAEEDHGRCSCAAMLRIAVDELLEGRTASKFAK